MPSGWRQVTESGHPGCLWLVLETEREEILFKARNWEIKDLVCSVSLACEASGYSLPALCMPGFKANGMNNSGHAACGAESISRMRCGAAGERVKSCSVSAPALPGPLNPLQCLCFKGLCLVYLECWCVPL